MSLLLIGLLVWLGFGPAFLALMFLVRLCTRAQPQQAAPATAKPDRESA